MGAGGFGLVNALLAEDLLHHAGAREVDHARRGDFGCLVEIGLHGGRTLVVDQLLDHPGQGRAGQAKGQQAERCNSNSGERASRRDADG